MTFPTAPEVCRLCEEGFHILHVIAEFGDITAKKTLWHGTKDRPRGYIQVEGIAEDEDALKDLLRVLASNMVDPLRSITKMIQQLYNRHSAGCCLHVVLDDENLEDLHVDSCIEFAVKNHHSECELLARAIRQLNEEQRAQLLKTQY